MKVYIVTRTCNEYNQLGEYFVCWVGVEDESALFDKLITVLASELSSHLIKQLSLNGNVEMDCFTTFHVNEYKEGEILEV